VHQLRALWSLHAIGAADESFLRKQLRHPNEHVRTWAVRLLSDTWSLDTLMSQRPESTKSVPGAAVVDDLVRVAREDRSALVRLALGDGEALQGGRQRPELATALVAHASDAADHNLPLLIWYGLIPMADANPVALAQVAAKCELPDTRRLIARRLAEDIEKNPAPLNHLLGLAASRPESFQLDLLDGLSQGLTGWRKARKPSAWDALVQKLVATTNSRLRDRVRELSVLFGDGRALDEVKQVALSKDADVNARKAALQTLIDSRAPDLRQVCEQLLSVRFLNPVAARGLATFQDPAVGPLLVKAYRQFHQSERPQLLATLVSRPSFVKPLLDAVGDGRIPRSELSAFHVRQIRSLNDPALNRQLTEVWGELRESAADKQQLIARLRQQLTPSALSKADPSQGRALFNLACANCHRLYGQGAEIGPDLTGAGRDNLEYLLENIADPSAVVTADFRMSVVTLKDGRVLNGVIKAKTDRTLTVQAMTERVTVERAEVSALQESNLSLMPEGLLEAMTPTQVRDLIAYLMNRSQVPLPPEAGGGR
jgi:putative heme-binding domain-containing protein